MYIDLVSDWPAYIFMAIFVVFMAYVIIIGNTKDNTITKETKKK